MTCNQNRAPDIITAIMKSFSVMRARRLAKVSFDKLTSQRLMQDRLSLGILIPTLMINGLNFVLLAAQLSPTDFDVPVRYSSLTGFEDLGNWYQIYNIAFFGLLVTATNLGLALYSYGRSRITSFFLLIGAFVVSLFCLIISLAFAAIV